MHLISKCNKGIRFLLCFIDIDSKYAWYSNGTVIIPLKDITINNVFQKTFR